MMPAGHHSDSDSTLLPLPKSAITWFGGIFARLPPLAAGLVWPTSWTPAVGGLTDINLRKYACFSTASPSWTPS